MKSLYDDFNVSPSGEQKLRQQIKTILGATPPNVTTLNKKAALNEPRYFTGSGGTKSYMIIKTNVEVKRQHIQGQPGMLYLVFVLDTNSKYTYHSYYVSLDWYDLYVELVKDSGLTLGYFTEEVEPQAQLAERRKAGEELDVPEWTDATDLKEEIDAADTAATLEYGPNDIFEPNAFTPSEEDCTQLLEIAEEEIITDVDQVEEVATNEENECVDAGSNESTEAVISPDLLTDSIAELPLQQGTYISSYLSHIMTSFNADDMLPPISVFYACIKQNNIVIDAGLFRKLISRILFIEWTNWLYERMTTTNQLTNSAKILIDTGFIKSDGQTLYSIVDVVDNYPRYLKLDCSLVDIKMAGLDKSKATNQLRNCRDRLRNNPLSLDTIDFNSNNWKHHILEARQYRFGMYKTLDYDTRLMMVLNSIRYACNLEERGISIKRLVRGSNTHVSVAIPLRFRNNNTTNVAIILTLNKFGVWEISTIETGSDLLNNLKAYNYYDMPSWLAY